VTTGLRPWASSLRDSVLQRFCELFAPFFPIPESTNSPGPDLQSTFFSQPTTMIYSMTPSFRSFHFSYLCLSQFVNQRSVDPTPRVLSKWMPRIASAPALWVFSRCYPLSPGALLLWFMCGFLPRPFQIQWSRIQTALHDFAKIFVFSWKTSQSSHSRISRPSATCLLRRWTISWSLGLRKSSTPLHT
jgi:hypothetical protein